MSGIIISITLLSGTIIAADGLTSYKLKKAFEEVVFDFTLIYSDIDREDILAGIETVRDNSDDLNVLDEVYTTCTKIFRNQTYIYPGADIERGIQITKSGSNANVSFVTDETYIAGADDPFINYPKLNEFLSFEIGNISQLNPGEILLDSATALEKNITIGDSIDLYSFWEEWNNTRYTWIHYNFSVKEVKVVDTFEILDFQTFQLAFQPDELYYFEDGPYTAQYQYYEPIRSFVIGNLYFQHDVMKNLTYQFQNQPKMETLFRYLITLKQENLPLFDIEETRIYLDRLKNRIIIETGATRAYIIDYITWKIYDVEYQLSLFETYSIIISIPTIFLGMFLTLSLYKLGLEQRRREFGLLKSRGASSFQFIRIFFIEAILICTVGGIIGSFLGIGISYGIISQILGSEFNEFLLLQPSTFELVPIISAVSVAIVLVLFSVYRPIKKYSKMTPVEVMPHYQEQFSRRPQKGKIEWITLFLGAMPIVLIFIGDLFPYSGIIWMFYGIFNVFFTAIAWLSPFLLIYALTKIIASRFLVKFTKLCEKIASIFSKKSSKLIATNIYRNPIRSIHLVFLISTTLCFGIVSQIVVESQYQHEFNQIYASVGADIKLDILRSPQFNFTLFSEKLYNYSDDIQAMSISSLNNAEGATMPYISVHGIDPDTLLNVSQLSEDYFYGNSPEGVLGKLNQTSNGLILSKEWADQVGFNIGDPIPLTFQLKNGESEIIVFEIVDYCEFIPGISFPSVFYPYRDVYYDDYIYYGTDVFVDFNYLNKTILCNLTDTSYTYFLDIYDNPTNDTITLGKNLKKDFPNEISYVTIFQELYNYFKENRGGLLSAIDLMNFQFPFLLIIASSGIIVLTYLSILEKRREMALMRARGVSKSILIKVEIGEGIILTILSILIGLFGFFIAWIMNLHFDDIDYTAIYYGFHRPYIVPIGGIILVILIVSAIFLSIITLSSYLETRKSNVGQIQKILRIN